MNGYVPNPPKNYRYSGVEPVDTHAQRWAEYKDRPSKKDTKPNTFGCVFAKSCDLQDGVIDHKTPAGFIPVEKVGNFGELTILGGREPDTQGNIPFKKVSGAIPATFGTLLLGEAAATAGASCGGLCTASAAVKHQIRIRRDLAHRPLAIPQMRWHQQFAFATYLHAHQALIATFFYMTQTS